MSINESIYGNHFRSFMEIRPARKYYRRQPSYGYFPIIEVTHTDHSNPFSCVGVGKTRFHYYISHLATENLMRLYLELNSFCYSEWLSYRFKSSDVSDLTMDLERILGKSGVSPYATEEFNRILYNILSANNALKNLLHPKPLVEEMKITLLAKGIKRWYNERFTKVPASSIKGMPLAKIGKSKD